MMASEAIEKIAAFIQEHGDIEILGENGEPISEIEFNDDDGEKALLVIVEY